MKINNFLIIIISSLTILICSCEKKPNYSLSISIKNETDDTLTVNLFPKSEYISNGMYNISDGSGAYRSPTFSLIPGSQNDFYSTKNINTTPNAVATTVFDSIHIQSSNANKLKMSFSPKAVVGYPMNLYNADSKWHFEKINSDNKTNFGSHPYESHNYTFVIL